ncbi:MAG: hypothetical protein RLZZ367_1896 [Bacteroidota bacterium]
MPDTARPQRAGYFLVTSNIHYWDYVSGDSYYTLRNDTVRVDECGELAVLMPDFTNVCLCYDEASSTNTQMVYSYGNYAKLIYYNNHSDSISGNTEYGTYHVTQSKTFAGHRIK